MLWFLVFQYRVAKLPGELLNSCRLNALQARLLVLKRLMSVRKHLYGDDVRQFLVAALGFLAALSQRARWQLKWKCLFVDGLPLSI